MGQDPNLKIVAQPQEFFRELITTALERQRVKVCPETEFYLVNLLNQFITTQNLYARDAEGNLKDEPLAFMVKEALEEPSAQGQTLLFRKVGDVSLYVAGYFQESLMSKWVDLNYYIGVGEVAYKQVAIRTEEDRLRSLYQELAQRFGALVNVFAEVSDQTTPKDEKNLLRLYDQWSTTRNARAEKLLQEAGIVLQPSGVHSKKKDIQ